MFFDSKSGRPKFFSPCRVVTRNAVYSRCDLMPNFNNNFIDIEFVKFNAQGDMQILTNTVNKRDVISMCRYFN